MKVLDFGISKIREGASALAPSKTQTGTAMGTPYYMSPEQVQGRKDIDGRTDIYAMGVMLFQALTGQYPFDGETYPMLVMSIVTQPIPQLSAYRPDLPQELQPILERMVAKDRANRFASVEEVKAVLAPFARVADRPASAVASVPRAPLSTPVQSEVRAVSAAPPKRFPVLLLVGALAGLVVVGGVAGAVVALWPERATSTIEPSSSEGTPTALTEPAPPVDPLAVERPSPPEPAQVEVPAEVPPSVPEPDESAAVVDPAEPQQPRSGPRPTREPRTPVIRPLATTPTPQPVTPPAQPASTTRTGTNDAPILR